MKKSIGFSVAAIILTVLYGMLCVGIFTNTGTVYNLYGVVIQDLHADASVYISLYVQTFLNAGSGTSVCGGSAAEQSRCGE